MSIDIGNTPTGKRPCIVGWPGFDSTDLPKKTNKANARRLVACWNAFDGMKTDIIEVVASMGGINPGVLFDVKQQRDELLEALRRIKGADLSMYTSRSGMLEDCQNIARAAIAKAEGGAA